MSSFQNNLPVINRLFEEIKDNISRNEVDTYFQEKFLEYEKSTEVRVFNNSWKKSEARKILQAFERIEKVKFLFYILENDDNLSMKHQGPSLITYLLLTCFDVLGQKQNWLSFGSWLETKDERIRIEREEIIRKIADENLNLPQTTKYIYDEYNKIYGVKTSFFNFIREVIPPETRKELFEKIRVNIRKIDFEKKKSEWSAENGSTKKKEIYLFSIRNDFTHNSWGKSGIYRKGLEESENVWRTRETLKSGGKMITYENTLDFNKFLFKTVLIGISEIIKKK